MDNHTNTKPSVVLIASQMPQQELGIIAQLLQSQGYKQQPADKRKSPLIHFETEDKANGVIIKFYQDIGALRLELRGTLSQKIGEALSQYMPPLTSELVEEYFAKSNSDMERRIYAILLVLTYADGTEAMKALKKAYIDDGNDATREGIVQGLAFMETPDVGTALETIEREFSGKEIANLARRAMDGLRERGIIRESCETFIKRVSGFIDSTPQEALEEIEAYGEEPALRAMRAKALRLLGNVSEAGRLLDAIHVGDPDAADAFCERALLREATGQAAQALGDAQAALVCDAQHAQAQEIFARLSLVLSHSGASEEDKIDRLTHALESHPDDANLLCQRAECFLSVGDHDAALADLLVAQKSASNDPRLPLMMCEAYLGKRYLGFALEQATRAQKNHIPAQETAAWLLKPRVYMAMGETERAQSALHEIPAELRDAPIVSLCSAMVAEQLGRADDARSVYASLGDALPSLLNALRPTLRAPLSILAEFAGPQTVLPRPLQPLDAEPVDPFFKRCCECGALTMKRRTQCRECGGTLFW